MDHSASVEVILFKDALEALIQLYEFLPIPLTENSTQSRTARQTILNIYQHILRLLDRANIDYSLQEVNLILLRIKLLTAIHNAYGTTEIVHPLPE